MAITDNLKQIYARYEMIRHVRFMAAHALSVPLLMLLYLLKPFVRIKLFRTFNEDRIGHLAMNTDLFLRRLQLHDPRKPGELWIGFVSTKPANKQLLKMFIRAFRAHGIKIIQTPSLFYQTIIKNILDDQSLFGRSAFFLSMPANSNEYHEFNTAQCNLSFTKEEEQKGRELLKQIGIPEGAWFVCIHARSPKFLAEKGMDTGSPNLYKSCDISNFLKAAEYITSIGGYVIHMGSAVDGSINTRDQKVINYAMKHRTDFGDIYLSAKCKFLLGSDTGLSIVPEIFGVPVAGTNYNPIRFYTPFRANSLCILKKACSGKENRYLSFRETLRMEQFGDNNRKTADVIGNEHNVVFIENSAEEICDLAKEMNERIDGSFRDGDAKLQKKFRTFLCPKNPCHATPVKIGELFLQRNKFLIE